MTARKKLTEKEKMFVKEFLIDLNATQGAIRAGYSQKTAAEIGYENLRKPHIQEALKEAMKKRAEKTELTAEYVIDHLMELVQRCMQKEPVMEWDYAKRRLEQAVDEDGKGIWQFDSMGANKALKSLGEHLGMFKKVIAGDKDNPLIFEPIQIIRPKCVKNKNT
jgi:phage terminase small subunit